MAVGVSEVDGSEIQICRERDDDGVRDTNMKKRNKYYLLNTMKYDVFYRVGWTILHKSYVHTILHMSLYAKRLDGIVEI